MGKKINFNILFKHCKSWAFLWLKKQSQLPAVTFLIQSNQLSVVHYELLEHDLSGTYVCHHTKVQRHIKSSPTIKKVKHRCAWLKLVREIVQALPDPPAAYIELVRYDQPSFTGYWLYVEAKLAIGWCKLG